MSEAPETEDLELKPDELDLLERYRKAKARRRGGSAQPINPAAGVLLSLRELPAWAMVSAPAANVKLAQVSNVDAVVFFGIRTIEGDLERLTPAETIVLLLIRAVKLGMLRVVGQLDPETIARVLGHYRPRIVRAAIRRLEDLELILVERERGRISKLLLHPDLMKVQRRPYKLSTGLSTGGQAPPKTTPMRQENAALISKGTNLYENPLPPSDSGPPPAAVAPPFDPQQKEEEAPRSVSAAGPEPDGRSAPSLAETGSGKTPSDHGINGHGSKEEINSRGLAAMLRSWLARLRRSTS